MEIVTNHIPGARVVEVLVIDSGVGISTEAKDHLFEPMWTTKQSGSGLGLAIAHEIIVEHGGEIKCRTEVQKGAEFRVVLPAVEQMSMVSEVTEVSIDAA
jgi:signal transduction histidine kinase